MRNHALLTVVLCLILNAGLGQIHTVARLDSLTDALKKATSDTLRIRIYHQLAEACPDNRPMMALAYEEQALALAGDARDAKRQSETYTNMGSILRRQSNYFKAISFYHAAIRSAGNSSASYLANTYLELGIAYLRISKLDSSRLSLLQGLEINRANNIPRTEASIYNMLGNVYKEENNYKEALEYYLKSTAIFETLHDKDGLTQSISNVGNIEFLLGNYDKALDYARQSLKIAVAIKKRSSIAYSNRLLGRIYRKQLKFDEALRVYFAALAIYKELGAKRDIGETHVNTGNIYYEKGDFKKALAQYSAALEIQRTIPDSANMAYSFTNMGTTLSAMKKNADAQKYLDSARLFAGRMKVPSLVMDVYSTLTDIYADEKNYRLAFENHLKYTDIKDSLMSLRNQEATADLEAKYQSEKKESEIRNLNSENEIKALQIQKSSTERNYLIAFAVLSLALVALLYNRYTIKLRTNKKLEELDSIKSRFFANISHEFRTPLSLIMGPLRKRIDSETSEGERKEELEMMYRNARRLHTLINQLLDLSKIESGRLKLQVAEGDISRFLKVIFSSFSSWADQKGIQYNLEIDDRLSRGFFDRDKLEKIIYNLISNALKFTPEEGHILARATAKGHELIIRLTDSGIGIPPDKLPFVFDRFYQIDDSATRSGEGTGIGLALSKELAELHHGTLVATSQEGVGSEFTLRIPVSMEAYRPDEIAELKEESHEEMFLNDWLRDSPVRIPAAGIVQTGKPIVLVAEDNTDMRMFIAETLGLDYQVIGVQDGEEALDKALKTIPDLVISDVMMPRMDGNALCTRLKNAEATSHIPLIMLTAKADQASKIEGLQTGADDYLTKPFDARELTVRVHNLIEQRKQLRKVFGQEVTLLPKGLLLSSADTVFLKKVVSILEGNYAEPDFDVDEFTREIGMSRMQLHRKLKALTDKSPGEFIRQFRLERAKQLLVVKGIQVSEVAYQVGFNNLSNFTKIFKEFTGVTPTEFISRKSDHLA